MPEPVVALVVAAGSGVRFGGQTPKALVLLNGRPLVEHSVEALAAGGVDAVVVVVSAGLEQAFADQLAQAPVPVLVVLGGARRQDSVLAGLRALTSWPPALGARTVLVHDAARPLVPAGVVTDVIAAVAGGAQAVIPVVAVVDSIRGVDRDGGNRVVDRSGLRAVQTPQGFGLDGLLTAHEELALTGQDVTDDAAVMERRGAAVVLVPGSRDSLKVTEPIDLVLAHAVLAQRTADTRGTP